jgi:hypothetical protein
MFDAFAGSLPLLQSFKIDTTLPLLDAFEVAPMLGDVTFACGTSATSIQLPWWQLKRCHACYLSALDCLYLVQRSANIVHCRLKCMADEEDIIFDLLETPMLRTHLCTLQLIVEERVDLANILDTHRIA